jgi:2-polyprenyl-6-methoxyphenol hydroxylase-like FAD-dependent oxidoreductase
MGAIRPSASGPGPSPGASSPLLAASGLRLTDIPDYLRWTLSAWDVELPITGRAFWEARGTALHRVAVELVADWHPTLRRIIDEADAAATFPFGIFSASRPGPWDSPNVTLLGDAIHTMTPGRGEGANTALRDAALLRTRLVEVAERGRSVGDAKADYEQAMLRYGSKRWTAQSGRISLRQ